MRLLPYQNPDTPCFFESFFFICTFRSSYVVFLAQALPSNGKAPFGFDLSYTLDLVGVFDQTHGCGLATVSQNRKFTLQTRAQHLRSELLI